MISVILCTHDPVDAYLSRSLSAIAAQTLDRALYELVIVDNRSERPISGRDYVKRSGARIVREETPGLTVARQTGIAHAEFELVVFVDDDNVLAPDYLATALELMADTRIGVLSGHVEPEYERPPEPWFLRFEESVAVRRLRDEHLHLTRSPRFSALFPIGAGMVGRREVLRSYYDTLDATGRSLGRTGQRLSSAEDLDIDLFAISRGFCVGNCGRLKLRHIIPPRRTTLEYVIALHRGSAESAYLVNRKWRAVFGHDVFPVFSRNRLWLRVKMLISRLLSFRPAFRVRYDAHRTVLQLLASDGRTDRRDA